VRAVKHIPLRFRAALLAAAILVVISTATRLALSMRPEVVVGGFGDWTRVFGTGLAFDLIAACYLLAPMAVWLALVPDRVARSWPHRLLVVLVLAATTFGALVLAVSEWLFWDEFGSRFNFIAVDYLLYTHEVLGNIWQSYPVGRVLLALAVLAVGVAFALRRRIWSHAGAALSWRAALIALGAWAVVFAGTLRWVDSDAKNFSARDNANDLAGNGAYEFFAANHRNELDYDRHYATMPIDEALPLVRAALGAQQKGVERLVAPRGQARRLNVVLVSIESLGAEFLGSYGNPQGLTPQLDRLSKESLWFTKVYATGNRTVRGMEALSLALPPTPGQSIVRRPNNDKLFSLGSVFEDNDYSVIFAYGGYGYFDNMNAFFDANDYRTIDRRAIPSQQVKHETVWGVADEHLFDHVLDELDREHKADARKPFFVHVMTTSNHRPYTYPAGRIDIPSGSSREGAVKYTDYAVGKFLRDARSRQWFDDTLFVITADHGANARGGSRIPVDKYLIPLFVYAPKHIQPRRVDRLMSQIDIPPTVLGLLDFRYYTKFFGRDILNSPPASDRAFIANYQTLGYVRQGRMALLQPKRKAEVFRVDETLGILDAVDDPQVLREAIAFYSVASFVFRNGLYRDEEQIEPDKRAALPSRPGGSH
jgi:phosphoglycerol transferase MdoB-like AlkP superfamily enzyme